MGVVQQAVADGVGLVGIADDAVPVVDGELAGDQRRGALGAVLDDFDQVASFGVAQRCEQPVVDRQQVELGQAGQQPGVGSVAPADGDLVQQPRTCGRSGR